MTILALEFSCHQRSAAVLVPPTDAGAPRHAEVIDVGVEAAPTFEMISRVLEQAGVGREQIDLLVIGTGPGSYTGIRGTIAIAQGWGLARKIRLLGISSVECIAAQAAMDGLSGEFGVLVDAQRQEFYLAKYALDSSGPRLTEPLRLATRSEVDQEHAGGLQMIGPEVTKWFAGAQLVFPSALKLAQMSVGRGDYIPGEKMEPIYLRVPSFVKAPPPRF